MTFVAGGVFTFGSSEKGVACHYGRKEEEGRVMLPSILGERLFGHVFPFFLLSTFTGGEAVWGAEGKNRMKTDVRELKHAHELWMCAVRLQEGGDKGRAKTAI